MAPQKKAYSTRMLERLTEAVKGFVEKSQKSDSEGGLKPSVREVTASGGTASGTGSRSESEGAAPAAGNVDRPHASGPAGHCAMNSLAEVDRERLLGMLRSGDDRGLDSKLKEILQS